MKKNEKKAACAKWKKGYFKQNHAFYLPLCIFYFSALEINHKHKKTPSAEDKKINI